MRLVGDVGMLKETAVTAALPLAANVLVLLGMVTVMMVVDWQLALIALLPLPALWFASIRAGKKIQTASRKQRKVEGEMAATAPRRCPRCAPSRPCRSRIAPPTAFRAPTAKACRAMCGPSGSRRGWNGWSICWSPAPSRWSCISALCRCCAVG